MKPKQRRAKLFRDGVPKIRDANSSDVGWLKAGYELENGSTPDKQWEDWLYQSLQSYDLLWMIEDGNSQFKSGSGPVGLVCCMFDNWQLRPHVQWFPWATLRNRLRGTVQWFMTMRRHPEIGAIVVEANEDANKWFARLSRKWIPLFAIGGQERNYIPAGRPDGNEYLWYMRGKRGYVVRSKSVQRKQHDGGKVTEEPSATSSN